MPTIIPTRVTGSLLFLYLFFSGYSSFSQKGKIDSLETVLKSAQTDTQKISLFIELASEYDNMDASQGLYYGRKALQLARQIHSKIYEAKSLESLGENYMDLDNYEKVIETQQAALTIYEDLKNEKGKANCYNTLGQSSNYKGEYSKAIEYHIKALIIRERLNDKKQVSVSYNNLGIVYLQMENFEQALVYLQKSLRIDEELGDKKGISKLLNNIGLIYANQEKYDDALHNYKQSLSIKTEIGDKIGMTNTQGNIGSIYYEKKEYSSALYYWLISLELYKELNNTKGISNMYQNIGSLYYEQKKYDMGIAYTDSSIRAAKSAGIKKNVSGGYSQLADIYSGMGDFKKAYAFHTLYSETKDSLLNEESSKQITEMQTIYETEKKEQQIVLLNKDAELKDARMNRQMIVIWSVACGFAVVLVLSVFIFRERKKSEKLLLNILPAETARELKAYGKSTARHYGQVTVMFTDFKGFTSIAEKLSAEELVNELDFLFRKFDEIISRYPIEKIKTIGDAYMCAGGLPVANTTNAKDIVSAALEIRDWMGAQNGKWNLRIGIHTGPVTAGVVGDKKFAYDIWGNAVNTASRMESSGEPGKVNISDTTHELIRSEFECEYRGKIPAKNKGEIGMFFVKNKLA